MKDSTITKIIAILSLLALYTVDALTFHIDHTITMAIVGTIAGLAGYEFGYQRTKMSNKGQ